MKTLLRIVVLLLVLSSLTPAIAQTSRQVNQQSQAWFSVNTTARIADRWAVLLDLHERRTSFMAKSNFDFIRGGIQYNIDKNLSVALGYGHMWLHPTTPGWKTVSNENRIYQQVIYTSKFHKTTLLQRFRNEQRWQQKIAGDKLTGEQRFTNRFRYLLSVTVPVFRNDKLPSLCIADEILLHMGKDVVSNTFDQNRFFAGIRQKISNNLSFDTGYMIVYQQKFSGYQYDCNNTFRLFFYYTPALHKKQKAG